MSADASKVPFFRRRSILVPFLALAVFSIAGAAIYRYANDPVRLLQPYFGQDLRLLSEDEKLQFEAIMCRLVPDARLCVYPPRPRSWHPKEWWHYFTAKPWTDWEQPQSWYFWQVGISHGKERLIYFQGEPLILTPGESRARIFVMERTGKLLCESEFSTG